MKAKTSPIGKGACRHDSCQGFTLVEILVVLAVIGLITGLAFPFYSGMAARNRLNAVAQEMTHDLRMARREALMHGRAVSIEFDPAHAAYKTGAVAKTVPVKIDIAYEGGEKAAEANPVVHFYGDGSGDPAIITLSDQARQAKFSIDWLTGHIQRE